MCLLLETIRVEDGRYCNPGYHQVRMDRSRESLFPGSGPLDIIEISVPDGASTGIRKCRIIYGNEIKTVEFMHYIQKTVRNFKLVEADNLDYKMKYLDRSDIDELQNKYPDYDEIILVKNGRITDTSFSNLAFLSGKQWFTPDEPILHGTCRQRLIDHQILFPMRICPGDLRLFSHVSMINAMLGLGDCMLPVGSIDL